jgi:hypothetical protein
MNKHTFDARIAKDGKRVLYGAHKDCGTVLGTRADASGNEVQLYLISGLSPDPKSGTWQRTVFAEKLARDGKQPVARRPYQHQRESFKVLSEDGKQAATRIRQVRLPASVQCPSCRRQNILDAQRLGVNPLALIST